MRDRIENLGNSHLDGLLMAVDTTFEIGQRNARRHGHGKSNGGGQQCHPDAAGKNRGIDIVARLLQGLEGGDHSEDRAEKTDQRGDLGNRVENPETALKCLDLRIGVDREHILDVGPGKVVLSRLTLEAHGQHLQAVDALLGAETE